MTSSSPSPTNLQNHSGTLNRSTTALLFAVIAISVTGIAAFGPLHQRMVPLQVLWGFGSVAWIFAVWRQVELSTTWIVLGAITLRFLALTGTPELSDDVYRYVWEGGLVTQEINPYAQAPNSDQLSEFRERWPDIYSGMNNREVSAAYPPVTQWVHAAVTAAAGGPEQPSRALIAMRIFYACMDLLCLIPLALLLRGSRNARGSLVAWAWSPLIAIEFAGSGHFDSLGVLALLSALAVASRALSDSPIARTKALGLLVVGALSKLIPGLLIPFVARGRRQWLMLLAAAAVFALAWLPFLLDAGPAVFAGLTEYGTRWEAGSLVFRHVEAPFAMWFERDGSRTDPRQLARLSIALVFGVIYVREWFRSPDLIRTAGVLIGSFLVLSPTLHPWYLAWIVPFVALRPSRAWLFLIASAPLLYWPLAEWNSAGIWREPSWLWPVISLPFFVLLGFDVYRARFELPASDSST
ncbi:MAG: hypothetical protein ACI8TQ_002686 [Planctomycetota bacterium]|jgi:hypothetical protein